MASSYYTHILCTLLTLLLFLVTCNSLLRHITLHFCYLWIEEFCGEKIFKLSNT
jgi:hypothetical protein